MTRLTSGTIYQSGDPKRGSVSFPKKVGFKFVPQAFFLGGILGALIIFSPLIVKEADYRISSLKEEKVMVADEDAKKGNFGELTEKNGIKILQPTDPKFSLLIPKIGVNSKVLANVSPTDDSQYNKALKVGVAHAAGTFFPGEKGTVYLFGHSTDFIWNVPRFNAVFYLLKELKEGDEIDVFYEGKRYIYKVSDKEIVDPSSVFYLKPKWGEEKVILQTCWPPGTTWKRLLIFAQPNNESFAQN